MKYILSLLCLVGCSTVPVLVPDASRPSVMETVITHGVDNPSYLWILWYIPVLVIVLGWSYVTFIKKGTKE